jgi:hypothetical protein
MDQLLCMIFAQLTARSSLRETVTCLTALGSRRYHCGIRGPVARSTLAEANERRDFRIFRDTALVMIAATRTEVPWDAELARLNADAYALDSTTVDLCLRLFPWAKFRRRKAGVKAHTLLDLHTGLPVFLRVASARVHDLWTLDELVPQAGAYYVFDKGYTDFARLHRLHSAGAFFITRAKRNLDFGIRVRNAADPARGVISDRLIRLRGPVSRRRFPDTLRLVSFRDPASRKRLRFLTNNTLLDAPTVALLYRKRWKIELFFKWVKMHLHIKAFFGTSLNAVATQVWIAVIVFVLVVKLKHRHQLPHDANSILQILSVTILEKTEVADLFTQTNVPIPLPEAHNQLSLFEI